MHGMRATVSNRAKNFTSRPKRVCGFGELALPAGRMSHVEASGVARFHVPARADVAAVAHISGIEAQPCDNGKGVAVARVNGNPAAAATFAIAPKITRR